MNRKHVFDDLPEVGEIELDLDYTYSFTPGKLDGPPENCYPDDEEMDITLNVGWKTVVERAYERAAREAIKSIEGKVQDLLFDNMPRNWWAEEEPEIDEREAA